MSAPAIPAIVELKALAPGHASAMYRWMLDPVVSANLGLRSEPSLAKTGDWIARASQGGSFLPLAVYWMERHVGNVIFDQIAAGSARLSVYIGESDARGKGIGTMALQAALDDVLGGGRFETVWLTVHHRNTRARHVYEKLGFLNAGEALAEDIPSARMVLTRADWRRGKR